MPGTIPSKVEGLKANSPGFSPAAEPKVMAGGVNSCGSSVGLYEVVSAEVSSLRTDCAGSYVAFCPLTGNARKEKTYRGMR